MSNRRLTSIMCAALLAAPAVASASLGVAAEPWLLDQMLQAQRLGNRSVEADALNRLMLLDADNPEFKLHWLRMQLDEPQRDAVAIDKMLASLCADETSKSCRQARLIMANDDTKRRQALSRVRLLETAGQYALALEAIESIFGGVPEELSWRLHYYELMLKVDGKRRIAQRALGQMTKNDPDSLVLMRHIKQLLGESRIDQLSRFGLEEVYSSKNRLEAIRALEEAIRLAPEDSRQARWRAALLDGQFWYALDRGDALLEKGRLDRAEQEYRKALAIDPESPYPYLGLSDVALEKGEWKVAVRYAEEALERAQKKAGPEKERIARKLANLRILPVIQKARALALENRFAEALATIDTVKTVDPYRTWLKGEWAQAIGEDDRAIREYRRLFALKDYRHEARIAVAKLLLKRGNEKDARALIDSVTDGRTKLTIANARDVAMLYRTMGEDAKAQALLERYANDKRVAGADSVQLKRDWAAMLIEQGQEAKALDVYRRAFIDAKIINQYPSDDEVFTQAMLTPDEPEPWDRRSLKREAESLYQRDNVWLTTAVNYTRDSGTPGYSDLTSTTSMVEMNARLFGGVLTLRGDHVVYDVGRLREADAYNQFGVVYEETKPFGAPTQREVGMSVALAWQNDIWSFDIGTTPQGFHYEDWVGGLEYSFDIGQVGLSLEAYRRAKDSSLLAFGGQQDPETGYWWGGVRRTGTALNLSWDMGGAHGVWSKLAYEKLKGHYVADNDAWQWMGGYYHRLIAQPNHETRLGISAMYWHFDKDLSGYTAGQGGYYSPQQYVSLGLMALDRGRTANWSWEVQGRIGAAYAKTDSIKRYPHSVVDSYVNGLKTEGKAIENSIEGGESGTSLSYSISATVERRLNEHWVLGATAGASKSEGYEPHYAMLYLRYSLKDWRGDLPMPPITLEPYSKW